MVVLKWSVFLMWMLFSDVVLGFSSVLVVEHPTIVRSLRSPAFRTTKTTSSLWTSLFRLRMESESSSDVEEVFTNASAAEVTEGEKESVVEEAIAPPKDPELEALKEEIASLESSLKSKRRTLAGLKDKADDYTKSGYARKVAEMENMRRARKMLQKSSADGAIASTLVDFLPVYDRLEQMNDLYKEDDFGKKYGALLISMKQAFSTLGVTEFAPTPGETVDLSRMIVESDQEDAQSTENNVVLRVVRSGLELKGNVVRAAQVVVPALEGAPASPVDENAQE